MDWSVIKARLKQAFGGGRWAPEEDLLNLLKEPRDARQSVGQFAAQLVAGYNKVLDKLSERQGDVEAGALVIAMRALLKVHLAQETGKAVDPGRDFLEVAQAFVNEGERELERSAWQGTRGSPAQWGGLRDPVEEAPRRMGWKQQRPPRDRRGPRDPGEQPRPRRPQRSQGRRPVGACYECGRPGHIAAHCPATKCFECGNLGHMARHCPFIKRQPRNAPEPMEVNFQQHSHRRRERPMARRRDSEDETTSSESEREPREGDSPRYQPALKSYAAVLRSSHARERRK